MNKHYVNPITATLIAGLIGGAASYGYYQHQQAEEEHHLPAKLRLVEEKLSETVDNLLGYTKFTAYLNESKKAISEQTKFLAARVDREYVQVEHIQKSVLGWKSEATVILKYGVEYSFGFDLRPDKFSITGDMKGITVTLGKPELVASPAVRIRSHEVPASGFFIDDQAAVIELQQGLLATAKARALDVQQEEAVRALCEKKLGDFLRDFLARQPNVRVVPVIKFAYK